MVVAGQFIQINNERFYAQVNKTENDSYVVIFDEWLKYAVFISSYYPSTQSYVYCIRQAAREYLKHLKNIKELEEWDGIII